MFLARPVALGVWKERRVWFQTHAKIDFNRLSQHSPYRLIFQAVRGVFFAFEAVSHADGFSLKKEGVYRYEEKAASPAVDFSQSRSIMISCLRDKLGLRGGVQKMYVAESFLSRIYIMTDLTVKL